MLTKETQEFLSKNPKDEEMMTFLEKNISERHLVHDDILSIIEMLNDEENKITVFGTLRMILPVILTLILVWILILVGWYIVGLPMGTGTYVTL